MHFEISFIFDEIRSKKNLLNDKKKPLKVSKRDLKITSF